MPNIFSLESNMFYLGVQGQYNPVQVRNRTTDGNVQVLDLAERVLWNMTDVRVRITTASELQSFESFYFANRSTPFLIYDPTHRSNYLEDVGTGDNSTTQFTLDHKYPVSGTLLVYLDGVLKTETTDYTVNYTTGVITFNSAPGSNVAITATYSFRRLCLFDGGYTWEKRAICDITPTSTQLGIISFDLVEVVNE